MEIVLMTVVVVVTMVLREAVKGNLKGLCVLHSPQPTQRGASPLAADSQQPPLTALLPPHSPGPRRERTDANSGDAIS
ncbi:hypothetical protein E2C01_017524 [Portunus trituberculatus]|uniref:Secreted protein n=1 Tax=Portunus trituberculatus TaxID=210409 RepID=A0A5B7DTZ6_PORTR|nr:hypothetical protein [Portunus trituberculatus]